MLKIFALNDTRNYDQKYVYNEIMMNGLAFIQPLKLEIRNIKPDQYLDQWPLRNTRYCRKIIALYQTKPSLVNKDNNNLKKDYPLNIVYK